MDEKDPHAPGSGVEQEYWRNTIGRKKHLVEITGEFYDGRGGAGGGTWGKTEGGVQRGKSLEAREKAARFAGGRE